MIDYYIYAYLRDDGTPYYIGKGKDYRAWNTNHTIPLPRNRNNIIIIERNLTEIGAIALERFYIRWYGRKDIGTGILRNLTEGGEGTSGWSPTEETRTKISNAKKNPSIETRKRLSQSKMGNIPWNKNKTMSDEYKKKISDTHADISGEKNPMYGRKHSLESLEKMRKKALERESKKRALI